MSEEHQKQMREIWVMVKNMKLVIDSLQQSIYDKLSQVQGGDIGCITFYMDAVKEDSHNCVCCWDSEGNYIS